MAIEWPGSCPRVAAHTTFLQPMFAGLLAHPCPSQMGSGWGSLGPDQLAILPCWVRHDKQAQHGVIGPKVREGSEGLEEPRG